MVCPKNLHCLTEVELSDGSTPNPRVMTFLVFTSIALVLGRHALTSKYDFKGQHLVTVAPSRGQEGETVVTLADVEVFCDEDLGVDGDSRKIMSLAEFIYQSGEFDNWVSTTSSGCDGAEKEFTLRLKYKNGEMLEFLRTRGQMDPTQNAEGTMGALQFTSRMAYPNYTPPTA